MKVCHMTSVHKQEDTRIFYKECVSLAAHGYETYQVACGETYDKFGVHQIGIGKRDSGKVKRMIKTARRVYKKAIELDADIYHLHDPELLPYGLKLKKLGKKVIFDSHEDVPGQIMDKVWIPKLLRELVSRLYTIYETHVVKRLDAVIAATPHIAKKFEGRAKKVVTVNNHPKLDDIVFHSTPFSEREPIVCYAGGINEIRGEQIMIEAMRDTDAILIIAGEHQEMEIICGGGGIVRYIGWVHRMGINELYGKSIVGLCILKPTRNYYYSKPTKIYEYMMAGLPFICSDFPSWKRLVEESHAGICVDPNDTKVIRDKIQYLLSNREKAQQMGKSGREYVTSHCTWVVEERNLFSLYGNLEG